MAGRRPHVPRARSLALANDNGPKSSSPKGLKLAPNPNYPQNPTIDNGRIASKMRPDKYDVMSGPAPMHTTNSFHSAATPQIGLGLGFNK